MNENLKEKVKDILRPAYYAYLKPQIRIRCENTRIEYESFRGKHLNSKCCIVANGASLQINDLNKLSDNNVICLGMNKIFAIYDRTYWRPQYYFVQDPTCIRNYYNELVDVTKQSKLFMRPTGQKQYDIKGAIHYSVNYSRSWKDKTPLFSDGTNMEYYDGKTVAYSVLQFAVYMGFSKIFLLGFDCDYGENNVINKHSYPDERMYDPKKIGMPPDVAYWFRSYEVAKKYTEERDISIINLTRGGKLDVFQRAKFDQIFR